MASLMLSSHRIIPSCCPVTSFHCVILSRHSIARHSFASFRYISHILPYIVTSCSSVASYVTLFHHVTRHVIPSRYSIMSYVTLFHHVICHVIPSRQSHCFVHCSVSLFVCVMPSHSFTPWRHVILSHQSCHSVTSVMSFCHISHVIPDIIRSHHSVASCHHIVLPRHSVTSHTSFCNYSIASFGRVIPSHHFVMPVLSFYTLFSHVVRLRHAVTSFYHIVPSHHSVT